MKKATIAIAATLACTLLAIPAWATPGNNNGPSSSSSATSTNLNSNSNVNANTNASTNVNANTQGQQQGQGQLQGQIQGQGQIGIVRGGSNTVNTGGNELSNQNSISVVQQAQERAAATATAPALTSANGTCLGSASAGVQVPAFGISGGSTKLDEGCDIRYDVAMLKAGGEDKAAFERGCDKPEIRAVRKRIGTPCLADQPAASGTVQRPDLTDPSVRRREGLAPL
jgi:hypothetical protein